MLDVGPVEALGDTVQRHRNNLSQTFQRCSTTACQEKEIFETNSSFHVKQCTTGKLQFLFFRSFLLVLTKFSFWGKD